MMRIFRWLPSTIPIALLALGAASARSAEPVVTPAVDGLFQAFERHPLVGLGDRHNLAQGHLLYENLIRDPRFAREVGNVVVEFGGAQHQAVIDRYVNGETVPYAELRQVWMNVAGWIPTVEGAYFAHFFFQVRQTNRSLPVDQRIKVWLGEPPIDWSTIHTREAWQAIASGRDHHAARLITDNILAKGQRALVIYGAYHFADVDPEETKVLARWAQIDAPAAAAVRRALQKIVEDTYPGAFFVAQVYTGFGDATCSRSIESGFAKWPTPALAAPVLGTSLEAELRKCLPKRSPNPNPDRSLPENMPDFVRDFIRANVNDHVLFRGDAMLYLGPADALTFSPRLPDAWLDEDYRREIGRRLKIMTGQELPDSYGRNLPESMHFTQRDHADGTTR